MIRKDRHRKVEDNPESELPKQLKDNPFRVPDNYFESLPSKVMEKIHAEKTHRTRQLFKQSYFKPLAIAASIALLAGVSLAILWSVQREQQPLTDFDTIAVEDIASMFNAQGLDEYTLVSMVIEKETIESLEDYTGIVDSVLIRDDIESYLLESNHIEYMIINSK